MHTNDWPISGPRTAAWVVNFFTRRGTGPEDHHRWWVTTCRLNNADWGVSEHSQCCRYLEMAGGWDQLDMPNVSIIELVARRLQTIEFQYCERVRQADKSTVFGYGVSPSVVGSVPLSSEEADIFDGQERIHSTLCCSPALVKHVSDQLKDESMIAKEARKAREEKAMAQHQRLSPTPPATQGADELATPSWPSASADPTKKKKKGGKGGGGGGQG